MSIITRKDVEHVAQLARLQLTDQDLALYTKQLASILEYVGKLQELDTSRIEPTAQVSGLENIMRPDVVAACPPETRQRLLDAMPEREDDLLKTTSVFT